MLKKLGLYALLLIGQGGVLPTEAAAAIRDFTLHIDGGDLTITGAGGATLPVWGYGSAAGLPTVPGPGLTVNEGDTVTVTVHNHRNAPHNFVVQNVTTDTNPIPANGSKTYTFTAPAAGSYLYGDTLNNSINREMGLHGALIVRPADNGNTAWTGGPAYDHERIWVISDMDKPRWNDVAAAGGIVNTSVYRPNYFMLNGLGGFDAMMDHDTMIMGMMDEVTLVRIVNAGQFSHSLHFHGNHFEVINLNGTRQPAPFELLDTINVPPMSVAEVLYTVNQTGEYPMHIHTAQAETANGVYLNGGATMIMMH
jgi:FtsP/CotA-like multicopper oxidase with cupredoxin domain